MPDQPVDATPSDTNLLLKGGVYGASEARKLSAAQRAELWSRWKAGQSQRTNGISLVRKTPRRRLSEPVLGRASHFHSSRETQSVWIAFDNPLRQ